MSCGPAGVVTSCTRQQFEQNQSFIVSTTSQAQYYFSKDIDSGLHLVSVGILLVFVGIGLKNLFQGLTWFVDSYEAYDDKEEN